ncbi:MAG: Uma2 family endonuclease, partial [Acidobacteriota bacterium]
MAHEIKTDMETETATSPSAKISYEEFLAQSDEDIYAEWVDGEVILMSPASNKHQDVADFLTSLFRFWAETHKSGVVRSAPFQMKTGSTLPGREPDVLFIANENLDRL